MLGFGGEKYRELMIVSKVQIPAMMSWLREMSLGVLAKVSGVMRVGD